MLVVGCMSSGCSLAFATAPPNKDLWRADDVRKCTRSKALPTVDMIVAGIAGVVTLATLPFESLEVTSAAAVTAGLWVVSSQDGFATVRDCRRYYSALTKMRLKRPKHRPIPAPIRPLTPPIATSPPPIATTPSPVVLYPRSSTPPPKPAPSAVKLPATTTGCRALDACIIQGQCTFDGKRCVAASRRDCAASTWCRDRGRCSLSPDGVCAAHTDADCAQSKVCQDAGRCRAKAGSCQ